MFFECAGIIIEIKGDIPPHISSDVVDYFKENIDSSDYKIVVCDMTKKEQLTSVNGQIIFNDPQRIILKKNQNEIRIYLETYFGSPYAICKEKNEIAYKIEYLSNSIVNVDMRFIELLPLEKILLNNEGCILHACFIKYNNQAIVFTAPSGTGKSTQGNLWKKYQNAEIINGDRCIIRKIDGKYYACGLPFCGSSFINRNEIVPLKAIVFVEQASINSVEVLEKPNSIKKFLSETSINFWNPIFIKKTLSLSTDIIENIQMVQLKCTISEDAVNVLKKELRL